MVAYPNFYETVEEAHIRLRSTVILYDGVPYFVLAITNHRNDGVFRIYMEPLGIGKESALSGNMSNLPSNNFSSNDSRLGPEMDKWLEANPKSVILRKKMNSPLFNKFRPFPLGMCNAGGQALYLERAPARKTEQGLTSNMVLCNRLDLSGPSKSGFNQITSDYFRDTICGQYPSSEECLNELVNNLAVSSAGFHRQFAFIKGPVSTVFLVYKENIVGYLPNRDFSRVTITTKFKYAREAIQELGLFSTIAIL